MSVLSRVGAQKEVHEKMKALEVTLLALKRRYNTFSLVSCLPPELLHMIFKVLAHWHPPHQTVPTFTLVKVTHVCSHWRRFALDCPDLWSIIDFHFPELAEVMLQRSKTAKLTVHASAEESLELSGFNHLHLSRTRELNLGGRRAIFQPLLLEPSTAAPVLEKLTVRGAPPPSMIPVQIPKAIFAGSSPRLHSLHLTNAIFASDSDHSWLHNLTSLCLYYTVSGPTSLAGMLKSVLEKTPNLENLVFHNSVTLRDWSHVQTVFLSQEPIFLRLLTCIDIRSGGFECAQLLNNLVFPATVRITLVCNTQGSSDILTLVSKFVRLGDAVQPVRNMTLYESGSTILIRCWNVLSERWQGPAQNPQLSLHLRSCSLTEVNPALKGFWVNLSLRELEIITILDHSFHTKETWLDMMGSLPQLKMVHISNGGNHGFLEALSAEMPRDREKLGVEGRQASLQGFPALRRLVVHGWNFQEKDANGVTLLTHLRNCLISRRECGTALRRLGLEQCAGLTNNRVADLKGTVLEDVDWDGVR